jgi:hypothetical protein
LSVTSAARRFLLRDSVMWAKAVGNVLLIVGAIVLLAALLLEIAKNSNWL